MTDTERPFRRLYPKAVVLVFLLLLGGLALLNFLMPDREFSENENTYLQQFPDFSWEALVDGRFTAKFEEYITEQFVFRDGWISGMTLAERALGRRSANGVYFGKDGYLLEAFDTADQVAYEKNLGYVADFTRRVQETGSARVTTILAPTAPAVLRDKLPRFAPEVDQRALLQKAGETVPGLVDVTGALEARKDEYIYYRTDHHWTSLGAFYAYSHWREELTGEPTRLEDYEEEMLSDAFLGTTYSKANDPGAWPDAITSFLPKNLGPVRVEYNEGELVTDTIFDESKLAVKDKYSVFFHGNQAVTRVETGVKNGERLLIIKDSYANAFAQMALGDYEEVYMLDLRYFKLSPYDFAEEKGITDIVLLYNTKNFAGDTNLFFLTT